MLVKGATVVYNVFYFELSFSQSDLQSRMKCNSAFRGEIPLISRYRSWYVRDFSMQYYYVTLHYAIFGTSLICDAPRSMPSRIPRRCVFLWAFIQKLLVHEGSNHYNLVLKFAFHMGCDSVYQVVCLWVFNITWSDSGWRNRLRSSVLNIFLSLLLKPQASRNAEMPCQCYTSVSRKMETLSVANFVWMLINHLKCHGS